MTSSVKLKYVVVVDIKDNKVRGSRIDFDGDIDESVKALIAGLKRPLYDFVRQRLIEPRQPGSAQVRILVTFTDKINGRSIEFQVQGF